VEDLYRKEHPFGLKILTRKQAIKRLFDWFDIDCSGTLKNAEMRRLINYTTAETEAHIIMDDYSKLQLAAGDPPESEGISLRGLDTLYKKDYGDLGEDWNTVKAHTPQISLGPGGVVLRYPKPHIHTRPVSRYQPASYPPDPISRISFLVHLFLEKSGNVLLDHLKFPREIYPSPDDPTGERLEPREFRRWQSWEGFQNVLTSKHESGLYDNQLFLTQKEIAEALVPDARDMLSHCWKAYDSNQDSCIDYNEYIQIPEGLRLKEVIAQNFPRLSSPKNESSFYPLNDSEIPITIDKISEPIGLSEFQIPRNIPQEPRDIFQNSLEIPGDSPGVPQNSIKITRDSSQNLGDPLEIPGDSFEIPGGSELRGKLTCGMAGKDTERGREQRICGGDLEKVSVDWEILEILSRFDDNYDGILTYTEFWPHYQERKNSGDMDTSAEAYTDPTDYRKFRAAKLKLEKWEKWRCLKENRPPKPQPQSMPRRVHQTWKSVKTVPVEVIPWMVSWVEKNPGWKHVFWSDEDNRLLVKQKLPFILPVFDLLKPVEQADIARNLYLYFFGGIYADMDFEAIKPLNHLQSHLAQNRATGFVGQEPRAHTRLLENRKGLLVSNAILGSAAGQLFWLALVARIILGLITESRQDPVSSTGPRILTSTYIMYYCLDPTAHVNITDTIQRASPDILAFDDEWFYPEVARWNLKSMLQECSHRLDTGDLALTVIEKNPLHGTTETIDSKGPFPPNGRKSPFPPTDGKGPFPPTDRKGPFEQREAVPDEHKIEMKSSKDADREELERICRKLVKITYNNTAGYTHKSVAVHHWMCTWCRGLKSKRHVDLSTLISSTSRLYAQELLRTSVRDGHVQDE